jgi:hypothetical protein
MMMHQMELETLWKTGLFYSDSISILDRIWVRVTKRTRRQVRGKALKTDFMPKSTEFLEL